MLYVMCGCPGSGKTTWCKENLKNAVYVGTDSIREELFGTAEPGSRNHERAVFAEYYTRIRNALAAQKDVVADATHTSAKSRRAILNCLPEGQSAIAVVMDTPLEIAVSRNESRARFVPRQVIRRMFFTLEGDWPKLDEGFAEVRIIKAPNPAESEKM